jgi:hypothetical protein
LRGLAGAHRERHRAGYLETEVAEPFEGDAIDIGEAVAQQLALALDPYPRAPGASLEGGGDSAQPARKRHVGD